MMIIVPVVVVFMSSLSFRGYSGVRSTPVQDSWTMFFHSISGWWGIFIAPLLIVVGTALLGRIEHSNKNWKNLFTLPLPRWTVYTAKLLTAHSLIILSMVILIIATFIAGFLLQILNPEHGLTLSKLFEDRLELLLKLAEKSPELKEAVNYTISEPYFYRYPILNMLEFLLKCYTGAWLLIAIHTWMSMRWQSLFRILSIGIMGILSSFLLASDSWGTYYPWIILCIGTEINIPIGFAFRIIGGIVVGVVGCWEVTRRDVL